MATPERELPHCALVGSGSSALPSAVGKKDGMQMATWRLITGYLVTGGAERLQGSGKMSLSTAVEGSVDEGDLDRSDADNTDWSLAI